MRPGPCGVTVTDSNAPLRPTSSRYVGTARETAGAVVTSGAKGGAAACAFSRLHPVAAVSAASTLRVPTAANPRAVPRAETLETNEVKQSRPGVIGLLQLPIATAMTFARGRRLQVRTPQRTRVHTQGTNSSRPPRLVATRNNAIAGPAAKS